MEMTVKQTQTASGQTATGMAVLTREEQRTVSGGHHHKHKKHKSKGKHHAKVATPSGGWPCQ